MKRFPLAGALLLAWSQLTAAQPAQPPATDLAAAERTALDAELFYELLLGELNARGAEPATGYALILDAARKTNDPALYQRAVDLAFQARSGDAALQAARAWKLAFPTSREANRYVLQILLALNRVADSAEPLKAEIALADAKDRNAALALIPRNYSRVSDKRLAVSVVEQSIAEYLTQPATASAAWTAVGRVRLAAGDRQGAIEAAQRAQGAGPTAEGPALLALELMDPKQPEAEALVRRYLEGKPLPELRMAYARELLEAQRYAEAAQQVQVVTRDKPDYPEAWLVQGTLQLQDNQDSAAEASLKRYLELAQANGRTEDRSRGLAQAYLSLSRIAEKRKDLAQASAWLDRIENAQDLVAAQQRRATLLAKQGRMDEARKLLRSLPERNQADARTKLLAEVQLLRDNRQYKAAYDLLGRAAAKPPVDPDLLYEQAMLAEKIGNLGDMERLLRQVMTIKPDYHHAYNALGYSLADRNMRLPEARDLIKKALTFAPDDPFISDSLGWVEFRMGNKAEALRILDTAYKARPDADIAAHLGEVLWSLGQRARAEAIWKEGLLLNADNDTLQQTLKRLRVKP
ncbi:tetratricopeptide repeat protein [Ramlibacter sp.]|uniref:tetratricopeptide repeat protein n=1 Tax=Ramlibacter sp. TaxID=1917967 RepID=UPI002CA6357F|nr:tetratricopeptide repeat protein [Ramlibacter sp.]HWI83858.1 tetratricopeptide repeat protein [Ramlibacter sp.]